MANKNKIELSLRPYPGSLTFTFTLKEYHKAYKKMFGFADDAEFNVASGRFCGKRTKGVWQFLIRAKNQETIAHEIAHVILELFSYCGIDPVASRGEPFCYMLSQLILDVNTRKNEK